MAEFSKLVVTRKGQALIAKMLAGTATDIDFTKVVASDAEYQVEELEGLDSLNGIMQEAKVSRKSRTNEVAVKVETAFSNHELTVGYHMRVLGLYARDPDDGEILYAACVELSGSCYMPSYNGITVSGAYIQLVTTVGNADNVNLEVNPAAIATIGDIQYLQEQISEIELFIGMGGRRKPPMEHKTYIARKRARFDAVCGPVNIPFGTEVKLKGAFLCLDGKPLCYSASQISLDHFVQNDDGQGERRATLVNTILTRLHKEDGWSRKRWNAIWADELCQKYKRPEHQDYWLWNPDFYNAPLEDLRHIATLISGAVK